MLETVSFDDIAMTLGFIVPGLIVLFVRSQFVTGRRPSHSESLLSYLTVSVIYYALALPFVELGSLVAMSGTYPVVTWFAVVIVGPALLGLLLGIDVQRNLVRDVLQRIGLNPVHVMPTAWDWKFSGMPEQWVLVTLKDGTRFAGFCGKESFMSSEPGERDIYIQWIYDVDDDDNWTASNEKGVLIAAGEIQSIEFWRYSPMEETR